MTTPIVKEHELRLEPVTNDPFIEHGAPESVVTRSHDQLGRSGECQRDAQPRPSMRAHYPFRGERRR